ncbi:hypothetical protein [Paraburkholderia sp. JPY419]|uniref:hypothetical protein n=1 Tax=Paraburkholderia sp. JPY419 TaxID=667660 RepID=UPI003D20E434
MFDEMESIDAFDICRWPVDDARSTLNFMFWSSPDGLRLVTAYSGNAGGCVSDPHDADALVLRALESVCSEPPAGGICITVVCGDSHSLVCAMRLHKLLDLPHRPDRTATVRLTGANLDPFAFEDITPAGDSAAL